MYIAVEEGLNGQINAELQAAHTYLAMSTYFSRDTVALPGMYQWLSKSSSEERDHAQKLIEYQTMRGGKVVLASLQAPEVEWKSARNALEHALQMEKDINGKLLALHRLAGEHGDVQLCDFLESDFLSEQVEAIKQLSDLLTQLARCGNDGLGLYLFDKELLDNNK